MNMLFLATRFLVVWYRGYKKLVQSMQAGPGGQRLDTTVATGKKPTLEAERDHGRIPHFSLPLELQGEVPGEVPMLLCSPSSVSLSPLEFFSSRDSTTLLCDLEQTPFL